MVNFDLINLNTMYEQLPELLLTNTVSGGLAFKISIWWWEAALANAFNPLYFSVKKQVK